MPTLAGRGGPALFRLVRFWSRRWTTRASEQLTGELRHVQCILAVEAVHTAGDAATVNAVAHQIGLDHSGASRMVRDAVAAGFLERAASTRDRRRAALRLTASGDRLLVESHAWQQRAFEQLTAAWTTRDRDQLAEYLQRLAEDLGV